jgi:hypothetical protein
MQGVSYQSLLRCYSGCALPRLPFFVKLSKYSTVYQLLRLAASSSVCHYPSYQHLCYPLNQHNPAIAPIGAATGSNVPRPIPWHISFSFPMLLFVASRPHFSYYSLIRSGSARQAPADKRQGRSDVYIDVLFSDTKIAKTVASQPIHSMSLVCCAQQNPPENRVYSRTAILQSFA